MGLARTGLSVWLGYAGAPFGKTALAGPYP